MGSGTLQAAGPQGSWLRKLSIRQRKIYTKSIEPRCSENGVSTRSDCHGNGRTGPHQRRVSYTANQGAHTDYGTRQTEVVAKWIGGARLSRGEGAFCGEERISPSAILTLLRQEAGVELLLHEAGPTLFGEFLAGGFMDELFLTVAPQIAGRDAVHPSQAWLPTFSFLLRQLPGGSLSAQKVQQITSSCVIRR